MKYRRIYWPVYLAETREQLLAYTLKSLLVYVTFLAIVSGVILARTPSLRYTFTECLKKQFIREKFYTNEEHIIQFHEIRNTQEFWDYMEKIICVYLYSDFWYSNQNPVQETTPDEKKLFFENKILGVPRLRQVRVRNDSCVVYDQFRYSFASCYGLYSWRTEDKSNFGLRTKPAWQYNNAEIRYIYPGEISYYGSGGYYQDLGTDRKQTEAIIKNLKDNLWIQRNTRAVFLDFTLFNGNVNLFCIMKFVFEFPPTGGIIPTYYFYPADLVRYTGFTDYLILFFEIVILFFILYYTYIEISSIIYQGKYYFKQCWNYVEMFILIDAYITFAFAVFRHFHVKEQIAYVNAHPDIYISYEYVGSVHRHVNNFLGITLFVLWIKVFKFLKMSKSLGQLNNTLSRCIGKIIGFSIMFFIIFFSFAQVGYILFGEDSPTFNTVGEALMTLLFTILGDFEYYEVEENHRFLAPVYFLTYIFLVFFVLINMFLAIITDTYSEVKEEIALKKMELEMDEYIKKRTVDRWLKRSSRVFPGSEIIEKIRAIAKMYECNYSYTEVQAFFSFHNFRDDKETTRQDLDELLKSIKQALEEQRFEPDDRKFKAADRITINTFISQQDKIELLELQVEDIREKLSEMLAIPGMLIEDED